ncbi:hypothetical protein SDC9_212793 [bioreactor metagenome]|uniref:Uncharacterized protein n=1 Tax=bioreactor metagenome TaxID=1076179 RepID=A0A645K0B5_9ZZZZ
MEFRITVFALSRRKENLVIRTEKTVDPADFQIHLFRSPRIEKVIVLNPKDNGPGCRHDQEVAFIKTEFTEVRRILFAVRIKFVLEV